jgi:hypothetical protein
MSNWFCCNCSEIVEMTVNGRCELCGSEALAYPEAVPVSWPAASVDVVTDVDRLYRLGAI